MIPSIGQFNELLKIIEKGKYKENLKKHEKYMASAQITFQKAMDPKTPLSKRFTILQETWGHCFNSIKFKPNSSYMWELLGDTSYERTQINVALVAYKKALEFNPENKDTINLKIREFSKLNKLFILLESHKLPPQILLNLLECISCGSNGHLTPYRVRKTYTVHAAPVKYKITSDISVPLCDNCMTSPEHNAKKNLTYSSDGVGVNVGKGRSFSYVLWQKYVILEKYKSGQINQELLDTLNQLNL
jgi:tetratricopeptide (TPR) repeat protein